LHPLEAILRLCAQAAPEPWYPRAYAEHTSVDPEVLGAAIEQVWLEKLIHKTAGSKETGAGFTLTPLGQRVLEEPPMLDRLRAGLPIDENDPGAVVRHSLRTRTRPIFSRLILLANLAVFAYGAYLASQQQVLKPFLTGFAKNAQVQKLVGILHHTGSVRGLDILDGEWWRLLTSSFVHSGLLHIGLNMYMLYHFGRFIEQTWGRLRFLIIYVCGAWGGSCLAMAHTPGVDLVGASGALFGIFAAQTVWVVLYGRYLPRSMARRAYAQTVFNLALLVFISLLPGVSGWGHLGGGVAGGIAALVLHLGRFGPVWLRWAPLLLLPLPWVGFAVIERAQARDPRWQLVEERHFTERVRDTIREGNLAAIRAYRRKVEPLLDFHPTRRKEEAVASALESLAKQRQDLQQLASQLSKVKPYSSKKAEKARHTGLEYTRATAELYQLAEECLRAGAEWKMKDERRITAQLKKVKEQKEAFEELLR
jgi:membrane associated rhomboid family serine protease